MSILSANSRRIVIVDVGAGYGKYLMLGEKSARTLYGAKSTVKLVGVEAEPGHFEFMKRHLLDNGVDWRGERLLNKALFSESYGDVMELLEAKKYVQSMC